jgi:hypothetical protein
MNCSPLRSWVAQWYSAGLRAGWSGVWDRVHTGSGAHPASGNRSSFPGIKASESAKLTTHLHLVPGSRMRVTVSPFPQYVFVGWYSSTFIHLCYACYMSSSSHPSWLAHLYNMWRRVQISKLSTRKSSLCSYYFPQLTSTYSAQHPVLKHRTTTVGKLIIFTFLNGRY